MFNVDLTSRQQELEGIVAKLAKPKKQRSSVSTKKRGMEAEVGSVGVLSLLASGVSCSSISFFNAATPRHTTAGGAKI